MNAVTPYVPAAKRAPDSPARASEARERPDASSHDDAVASEKSVDKRPDFATVLAILAGAGADARAAALQQLPPDRAGLVDRLLSEVDRETQAGVPASDAPAAAVTADVVAGQASDAMRYGRLAGRGEAAEPTPTPFGHGNLHGLARALQRVAAGAMLGEDAGTTGMTGKESEALQALTRVVERRGASVEQLLALGDLKGADLRTALDDLLSQAGTPAATELAALAGSASTGNANGPATPDLPTTAAAAAASAIAAARAKSAGNVGTPTRDASALVPELRTRLDRVVDRMKEEFGHDVQLVETTRSQERQDHLFAQGRTRPGPVVTWTRDSQHLHGQAVDVIVDGKWDNPEGYARLQRVAREEGLRTLGVRDPGHLELPRDARSAEQMAGVAAKTSARIEGVEISRPAPRGEGPRAAVAGVAGVASVAGVAGVAGGANMASSGGMSNGTPNGNAFGREERTLAGRPANDGRKLGHANRETDGAPAVPAFGVTATAIGGGTKGESVAAPAGVASLDRVTDLQALRDSMPGSVSRLSLQVDGPNGGSERITLDTRGGSLSTHIATDQASADRMRLQTGSLQDALGRHGLDADTVRVSATARTETVEATRGAVERDALRLAGAEASQHGDASGSTGRDRNGAGAQEQQERQGRTGERQDGRPGQQGSQSNAQDARQAREDAERIALLQRVLNLPFTGTTR